MSQVLIVVNPVSGSGKKQRLLNEVVQQLKAHGNSVILYATRSPGDASRYLQSYQGNLDIVAVAGGDGTVNDVVNGLIGRDNQRYRLALIPAGTTNVLATELGLRSIVDQVVYTIEAGHERALYPGRINGRRFLLMAGVGYDARVVDRVNPELKKAVGKLAYVWSMLQQLRSFGRKTYRIDVDGQSYEANSVVITNGRYYGGSFVISPQADIGRPDIQVLMMTGRSAWKLLLILSALPFGRMERMPGMRSISGRRIRITDMDPHGDREPVQADGDSLAELPLEVYMEETPLRVLVP